MKWSRFPVDMQDQICKLRREGLSAAQVQSKVRAEYPDHPISIGGIYHVERRRKGTYRRAKPSNVRPVPLISLAGPAWSIPDHCQPASTRRAA